MASLKQFKKYETLYTSNDYGGAKILREFIGVDKKFPIPLTLAHGVDFDCDNRVIDIDGLEPIYWSTNEQIHTRASKYKPSVLIPHPWILLDNIFKTPKEDHHGGCLVIGPPPGPKNDMNLMEALSKNRVNSATILIKRRGDVSRSEKFWNRSGYEFISAGTADEDFYLRLYRILNKYDEIYACTISSALFFAAALGKTCRLLRNVRFGFYDHANWLSMFKFSNFGKEFVNSIIKEDKEKYVSIANYTLGRHLEMRPEELLCNLQRKMAEVYEPIHHATDARMIKRTLVNHISLLTKNKSIFNEPIIKIVGRKIFRRPEVISLITLNEVNGWLYGATEAKISLSYHVADKGKDRWPGCGI